MTIQSQLDQVLALVRGMPCGCMSVAQLGERDPGCDRCQIASKLSAIRAAVGGEAVAWMLRRKRDDFVRGCYATKPTSESLEFAELDGDYYTPLYTSPTATVDVGAFDRLREKWISTTNNTFILRSDRDYIEGYDEALKTCAKELAALIGKEA